MAVGEGTPNLESGTVLGHLSGQAASSGEDTEAVFYAAPQDFKNLGGYRKGGVF